MAHRNDGIGEEGELFATHIGGSALPEGVMMRGKLSWAAAVREPSGRIYVEEHELSAPDSRPAWQRLSIVRGCVSFVESMLLSYKAMCVASDHAYDDEGETYASLRAPMTHRPPRPSRCRPWRLACRWPWGFSLALRCSWPFPWRWQTCW